MNTSLESSLINGNDKYYNMRKFINATANYIETKAEESANLLNRHLQLISETIDVSIFDPHTNIVAEFIVCLHELLGILEPACMTSWSCVGVLNVMCKNPTTRIALIQTYQFIPLLTKLLNNQLTIDKKLHILTLMQVLSCGIKISWQIPHLSQLMSTLTQWIENGEEEVVMLSLAVLVNLCYKNLPAVYTLSRCVDIKKFIRICMPLKGLKIEVHVCKLLIILDYMNGKVPEEAFLKLIEVTFKSLIEAFKTNDFILLRHIVEFFLDTWDQNSHSKILLNFTNYDNEVENLLLELESTDHGGRGDIPTDSQSECVAILFQFLHFVIQIKQPNLKHFHSRLVNLTLKWIQVDVVCSNAFEILHILALNSTDQTCVILEPVLASLPIFLLDIVNGHEETHTENNKRLKSLMELMIVLINLDSVRKRVLAILKEELFVTIFNPLFGTTPSRARSSNSNMYTLEAVLLYVSAIAVINELKKYENSWKIFFTDLMQHKQIHIILAQAFYSGTKETKVLVMSMSSDEQFPINQVAAAMCELQYLTQIDSQKTHTNQPIPENFNFPMMSVTQIEKLDSVMNNIRESYEQKLVNASTAEVMELYEYKLASMRHAERAAVANIEAASYHCTHLQHKIAQLTAEVSKVRQLWLHTQHCLEDTTKTKETILTKNTQLQEWLDAEKRRYNSQLSLKEKLLNEKTQLLEDTTKQLKEADKEKNILEEKHAELKRIVAKLEDNLLKKEKLVEKKEEQILRSNATTERLRLELTQLEKQVKRTEAELSTRTRELAETSKDLQNCKSILGTITQLTNNSQYGRNNN